MRSARLLPVDSGRGLSDEIEAALAAAARDWPALELLVLFGSAASRRLTADSDVDLYVRLTPNQRCAPADAQRFAGKAEGLCRREIHLVVETLSTSVILRREVAARGRALFQRTPSAARTFRVEAMRAYADLEPQLRKIGAAIRARAIREGDAAVVRLSLRGAGDGR